MDAVAALAELTARNADIERAAIFDADGATLAATPSVDAPALGRDARALLDGAGAEGAPEHVLVTHEQAGVMCVRSGGRLAVAVTGREPIAGLLLFDLRACLRQLEQAPRRRRRTKAASETDA